MELRHIRYFVRAAELLHFTQAAESLYISQPTLSTHIQQLEEELGSPLFDRVGRHVRLTEAGEIFLTHAQCALRDVDVAKEKVADLKGLKAGTIRLGALLTFGREALPSWVAGFHAAHPKIHMSVVTGTSDALEAELLKGEIDLALSFVPPANEDITANKLFTEKVYLVVGKTHPFASKKQVTLKELGTIPLGLVSRRWAARRLYDAYLTKHSVSPDILIEVDDLQALLKIASEGHIGVMMSQMAAGTDPNLVLVPIAGQQLTIEYGVLWQASAHLSEAAQAFLDHIKTAVPANGTDRDS